MIEMAVYDLYEVKADTIYDARRLIEMLLSIVMQERESTFYRCPYFSAGGLTGESLELVTNLDPFEDVVNEDDYPDSAFVLYVNNTNRSSEIQDALAKSGGLVNLLRHHEL